MKPSFAVKLFNKGDLVGIDVIRHYEGLCWLDEVGDEEQFAESVNGAMGLSFVECQRVFGCVALGF